MRKMNLGVHALLRETASNLGFYAFFVRSMQASTYFYLRRSHAGKWVMFGLRVVVAFSS